LNQKNAGDAEKENLLVERGERKTLGEGKRTRATKARKAGLGRPLASNSGADEQSPERERKKEKGLRESLTKNNKPQNGETYAGGKNLTVGTRTGKGEGRG